MIRKLKILGTYSPYPKKMNNCPGFLITSDTEKILLDCGNGILRFLRFPNDLKNLSVFISHMHNDHFGDLGALQYAAYTHHNLGNIADKITIYLPRSVFSPRNKNHNITLEEFSYADFKYIIPYDIIGDIAVSTCLTTHSDHSYAIKLQDETGLTIVYTSDISYRDKDTIVRYALDADVFICDSSFIKEHGFPEICSHLTAEQAAILAKEAKVRYLVLTHFWPEEDIFKYLREAQNFLKTQKQTHVILAEEGLSLNFSNKAITFEVK